jgi:xanthine dehydrogenase accessory factor
VKDLLPILKKWASQSEEIAVATIVRAEGSSPRPAGACLITTESGRVAGSISNGCVEGAVVEQARRVLSGEPPKRLTYGPVEEGSPEVGLTCGGSIDVFVERFSRLHELLLEALGAREPVALVTPLDGADGLLIWPDGRAVGDARLRQLAKGLFPGPRTLLLSVGVETTDSCQPADTFVQVFAPPATLVVVGASHIAVPLVALARTLGYSVKVVDARRLFATPDRFPTVDQLEVAWPEDALKAEELGPNDHVVVLSHDPRFDIPALRIALQSDAGYVGLLGSKATQKRRRDALSEEGVSEAALARIHGPVGLDLGATEPAEIALAIMAEIVAVRHGKSGESISVKAANALA